MILEKRIINISKYLGIHNGSSKTQKLLAEFFLHFWMPINPKPNWLRLSTLLILTDHMEDYHKIQKQCFRELFLPENDFKTCSTVNFPKKSRFWRPRNQPKTSSLDLHLFLSYALLHINSIKYQNCFGHLIGTYWKWKSKLN